ncbi:hypothetical protein BDW68DRAFT_178524 [Aspergillus falconensis]
MYLLNWSWQSPNSAIAQESDDCSDVPYGSQINVSQPSDMEQFANCTTLVGDMVIQGGYQRAILLPNMAHMDGAIRESHNGPRPRADNVSMPSLKTVKQAIEIGGDGLVAVDLSSLVEVRGLNIMWAKLESSRLRKLRSFNTILVNSHWNFDGDAFTAEREENSGYLEDGSSVNYNSVKISGISKIAKILIGISVLLGVAILISVAIYIRQKRCEALKEMKENELVEMRRPTSPARESEPSLTTAPVDIVPDGSPPPYTPNEK